MPRTARILIIEDSVDDAELVLLELSRQGIVPDWKRVETAAELRAALAEEPWDLVLSDNHLPTFGAPEALPICREIDPDLPFIVVSGTIGEEAAIAMMRAGAADYLFKDKLARLAPTIEREMQEAALRRKRRSLEEATHRLAAIVESSEDAILSHTPEGIINSWNAAAQRVFGWESHEVIGRHFSLLVPPEKNEELDWIQERQSKGQALQQYETVRLRKDGTHVEVSITISPLRDLDGRLIGVSRIARDITQKRLAERNLRQQKSILQSILDNMGDGVVVADAQGRFILFNPAAERILALGQTETLPEECSERYSLYKPDGETPFPTEELPLVKAIRGGTDRAMRDAHQSPQAAGRPLDQRNRHASSGRRWPAGRWRNGLPGHYRGKAGRAGTPH